MRRSSSDRRKIVLIACVAVLLALAEVVLKTRAETADVRIRILAVDRGSAALITDRDGRRLLVDDGADASLLESLAAFIPWWDRRIDALFEEDQIAADQTSDIGDRYNVGTRTTDDFPLAGGAEFRRLGALGLFICGADAVLFASSFTTRMADDLPPGLRASVIIWPDHVVSDKAAAKLLAAKPTEVVVSAGSRSRIGKGTLRALDLMRSRGMLVFRTDLDGVQTFTCTDRDLTHVKK